MKILEHINNITQNKIKMNPTFGVCLADTQRNTCKNPNAQQLPHSGLFSPRSLECLEPPDIHSYVTLNLDFSQAEARGAVNDYFLWLKSFKTEEEYNQILKEDNLIQLFNDSESDFHSLTGFNVFCQNKKFSIGGEYREITLKDFIKHKKEPPFNDYRQKSKTINFGLLYGGSAATVFAICINNIWTIEELKNFIKENSEYSFNIKDKNDYKSLGMAVSECIRERFLESYPALRNRLEFETNAGIKGYTISYYGHPCLVNRYKYLYDINTKDKEVNKYKVMYQHKLQNFPIQNYGTLRVGQRIVKLNNFLRENKLKTRICDTVHDSVVIYVYIPELKLINKKAREIFTEPEENDVVPFPIDMDYAYYGILNENPGRFDSRRKYYYHEGVSYEEVCKILEQEGYIL